MSAARVLTDRGATSLFAQPGREGESCDLRACGSAAEPAAKCQAQNTNEREWEVVTVRASA